MLFNSIYFAVFLILVFLFYWFVVNRNLKLQNFFIVCVSYLFYGWWDWRFLILIAFTTSSIYFGGIPIKKFQKKRFVQKIICILNIILNLVILGIFKYFNFFSENLEKLFESFGYNLDWVTLDVLLPVGISFYTFQALSYIIDVYNRKLRYYPDIISFFAYVSFFPQLIAGPIERSTKFLPQFYVKRRFDYTKAVDGLRQILWGLFKKMVVADNCAVIVNQIFGTYTEQSGSMLIIGAILFTFQIYGDFSGYSDIAIGTARLFGFDLMQNFNYPYFSRNIAEFWRRWHISLMTWFRDYIYIPLGGNRVNKIKATRNIFIVFLISGLWHGANWTFVAWGTYHALLFLPLLFFGKIWKNQFKYISPELRKICGTGTTFISITLGFIIFRAENISQAYEYVKNIFTHPFLPLTLFYSKKIAVLAFGSSVCLILAEWIQRRKPHALYTLPGQFYLRWGIYYFLVFTILFFSGGERTFIYFQF